MPRSSRYPGSRNSSQHRPSDNEHKLCFEVFYFDLDLVFSTTAAAAGDDDEGSVRL